MGRVGFNPVIAKYGNSFTSLRSTRRKRRLKALDRGYCNVYFVQDEAGMIKIGYAKNVGTRYANLQACNASELRMLVWAPGDSVAEERLHSAFARHRRNGEWFAPAPEILAYIAELKAAVDFWDLSS
jgi:hypothetical protein